MSLFRGVSRWPGGASSDPSRWCLQRASGDALGAVPATRWSVELVVDVRSLSATQLLCVGHGGFITDAERFDCLAFGISVAEASAMDPQQRLLLELGYASLRGSGLARAELSETNTAIYVGVMNTEFHSAVQMQNAYT